ncbi:MAG: hypothetical protein CMH52_12025 [Myxococcales bacterium]|nr:hypothetical protein [Myxococcales bacterium]
MKKRSLTAKTLILSFGKILAAFATIGIGAILTRCLSVADFATHKQALMTFAMCAPMLGLGLPKALYFFLPGEQERPRSILIENLSLLLLLAIFFCGFILLGGDKIFVEHFQNPRLGQVMPMVAIYGLCMLPMAAISATLMARDRVENLVTFQLSTQALLIVSVGCAAYFWRTPSATVSAYAIWAIIALTFALILMFKVTRQDSPIKVGVGGMKQQLAYGVPLGLAGMFGGLSGQIDKYMVSIMCSTEDFGIYVAGAVELPLIGVITGAMNAVVLPELAKHYKNGRLDAIRLLWQRAMNKAILILAPAMFIVLLFGTELIVLLFSERYAEAATPFRIYALSLPVRAAVYGSVLMATNNTKWVTGTAFAGLSINVVLNLIFVELLGSTGAAWATVLTVYSVVCMMLYPLCRALKTTPFKLFDWPHLVRVLVASATPAVLIYFAIDAMAIQGIGRLLIGGAAYGLLVLVAYRLFRITTVQELIGFIKRRT